MDGEGTLGLRDVPLLPVEASSEVAQRFMQTESLCSLSFCSAEVWTLSSQSHSVGHHQVFVTLFFRFKGKVWFCGRGQVVTGAGS